jgi:hypothetical protein
MAAELGPVWEPVVPSDYAEASTIRMAMAKWGMEFPRLIHEAKQWYVQLENQSYFTKALMVPYSMPHWLHEPHGIPVAGILLAVSTAESTNVYKQGMEANRLRGMPIHDPEWRYFTVYWYPGCTQWNIHALSSSQYDPQELPEKLGGVLERRATDLGITDFRAKYCVTMRGNYYEGLRRCMHELGMPNWMELTTGISWQAYRGIDVYVKIYSYRMPAPKFESWWLLNTQYPPDVRHYYAPEQWWLLRNWVSVGQKQSITEHAIEDVRHRMALTLASTAVGGGQAATLRMHRIIHHIFPPGEQLGMPDDLYLDMNEYGKGYLKGEGKGKGKGQKGILGRVDPKGIGKGLAILDDQSRI